MPKAQSDHVLRAVSQGTDAGIRSKYLELPSHIDVWVSQFGTLANARVLDFGCGFGITALGLCSNYGAASVLGVDINREHEECLGLMRPYGVEALPDNLCFEELKPGERIGGEGDFDVIYSWSVFEHVHLGIYNSVIEDLYDRLKVGGLVFVQIAPLYYSAEGSHCWEIGFTNWEHLELQGSDFRAAIGNAANLSADRKISLLGMYDTLNRVTADSVVERFQAVGFKLLREQRDRINTDPPRSLLQVYNRDVLTTYQLVALFTKR